MFPASFKYIKLGKEEPRTDGVLVNHDIVAVALPPESGWFASALATVPSGAEVDVPIENESAAQPECVDKRLEVSGFANGTRDLSEDQQSQLAAFTPTGVCTIVVTGYSSTSGDAEMNLQIAQARAGAVAAQLRAGLSEQYAVEVVAFGETAEFGGDQASNRRVVVVARAPTP